MALEQILLLLFSPFLCLQLLLLLFEFRFLDLLPHDNSYFNLLLVTDIFNYIF